MLKKAIKMAEIAHKGQTRNSGEEYIVHPLAVMSILKHYKFPQEALVAAVLHDVTEDSKTTNLDIMKAFGERVGFIIYALSKNKKPNNLKELKMKWEKERKRYEKSHKTFQEYVDYRFLMYVNRFYTSGIADPWIFFIKMADQIHNLSTLEPFSKKKRARKIIEVEKYFMPIYEKASDVITPLYHKRYQLLIARLKRTVARAKVKYL